MASTYADTAIASNQRQPLGEVVGAPRLLLRMEGGITLAAATAAYGAVGQSWTMFAILFLVPDISMLGYLAGRRIGAAVYNLGHSYLAPAGLCAFGHLMSVDIALAIGLVWVAHIGFDRAVGYGLKYQTAFKHTHLGLPFAQRAGRGVSPASRSS